jgi:hypothetical protein
MHLGNFRLSRRQFLYRTGTACAIMSIGLRKSAAQVKTFERKPTVFQHACMTLPYSAFPLERALTGIKGAGFRYVAWGVTHREGGEAVPVMAEDASLETAKALATKCRDLGLEPVMMFSTVYPEHPRGLTVLTQRIKQARAAGIGQVLTFGHTKGGNRELWIERRETTRRRDRHRRSLCGNHS